MKTNDDNLIVVKSKAFALRIIKLFQHLCDEHKEYVMSKQLLRSGTNIGANVKEAIRAQTKPDFGTKMNYALKEASESEYWIELLSESGYMTISESESILEDCRTIIKILTSIVKSTFTKNK